MKSISECTVLITGATDGLGQFTAERFAQQGARVLLHGRNEEKGQKILKQIKESTGNQKLAYFNGDFSSLESVNQLAEDIVSSGAQLDVLINNAGIGGGPETKEKRETSQDGFELRWQVNYLAQVLLTEKLIPIIKGGSRIINVASTAQKEINFDDLNMENTYDGYLAYARSKLAFIMYTFDLSSKLKDKNIMVNAIHPSTLMNTSMVADHFGNSLSTVKEGYEAIEFLVSSSEINDETGTYFKEKTPSKAHPQAYDPKAREQLNDATNKSLASFI